MGRAGDDRARRPEVSLRTGGSAREPCSMMDLSVPVVASRWGPRIMNAAWSSLIIGMLAGCQCGAPSDEPDGGSRGVAGGGRADAGPPGGGSAGCSSRTDCTGDPAALAVLCSTPSSAAWTCALGSCVVECSGGRTCTATPTAECLTCNGTQSCTSGPSCPFLEFVAFEQSTCGLTTEPWLRTQSTSSPCQRRLVFADGGVAGTLWAYASGSIRAELPALGGSCVGAALPPNAMQRFSLSCPACSAVIKAETASP